MPSLALSGTLVPYHMSIGICVSPFLPSAPIKFVHHAPIPAQSIPCLLFLFMLWVKYVLGIRMVRGLMQRAFDTMVEQEWLTLSTVFLLSRLFATPLARSQRLIDGTAPFGNG